MIKTSGTYAIFKGKGAAKFSLMYPRRGPTRTIGSGATAEGFITKYGGVLLEAAPVVGKRPDGLPDVDWGQKLTFGIGVQDIALLLDRKTEKLIHKIGTVTKTLAFQPGTGAYANTYKMFLNSNDDGKNKSSVFVPFSEGEFAVLQRLLVQSLPILLGWTQ